MQLSKKLLASLLAGFLASGISYNANANFASTIPVVDLQEYRQPATKHKFIRELSAAFQQVGFVAVVNPGVELPSLDAAYLAAAHFFQQPSAFKQMYNRPSYSGQRGYVLSEKAKGFGEKDYKEFYHLTRDYSNEILQKYSYQANVWPDLPGFKPTISRLITELNQPIELIQQALAESLGLPQDHFSNMTTHGDFLVRLLHYPANPPANTVWAAEHTDIDLFTIIPKATASGLQVKDANGNWIDVKVPNNAFIVNAGDMLRNISNGVYRSSVHRVVSNGAQQERYSIVAFIHPRPNDKVDPLPQCIARVGKREYANATQYDLLSERLADLGLASPQRLQSLASSGLMERLIAVNKASPDAMLALKEANLASAEVLNYLSTSSS